MLPGLGFSFGQSSTASNGPFTLTGGGKAISGWAIVAVAGIAFLGLVYWLKRKK